MDPEKPGVSKELKDLHRRGFQFLRSVTLRAGPSLAHTITFGHDGDGNLTEVVRPGSPRAVMRAFIAEPTVARKILVHLGLETTGPPLAPAHRDHDPVDPAPDYDLPDPCSP